MNRKAAEVALEKTLSWLDYDLMYWVGFDRKCPFTWEDVVERFWRGEAMDEVATLAALRDVIGWLDGDLARNLDEDGMWSDVFSRFAGAYAQAEKKWLIPHTPKETRTLNKVLAELDATIWDLKKTITDEESRRRLIQIGYAKDVVRGIRDAGGWVKEGERWDSARS